MKENLISAAEETADSQARREARQSHRILVVDDDDDIRLLSANVLLGSGYEVDAAKDGAAGWDALHANHYDLLLSCIGGIPNSCEPFDHLI